MLKKLKTKNLVEKYLTNLKRKSEVLKYTPGVEARTPKKEATKKQPNTKKFLHN